MNQALLVLNSLAVGLLLGMDRERSPGTRAGLRTFALAALFGSLCAALEAQTQTFLLLPAGMLVLGAMMIAAYRTVPDDPGTTTTVALLICYGLGAMIWLGQAQLATALALVSAMLLHFKTELHGAIRRLSEADLRSMLQFAVIAFVVLPALPDQGYGPYGALNPYRIWWMVVLVSGISLAAYAGLRLGGERLGLPLMAALGGAVSSTGTTLVISRAMHRGTLPRDNGVFVILGSNLVVLLRLALIAAAMAPTVLPGLAPVFLLGAAGGGMVVLRRWWRMRQSSSPAALDLFNPVELVFALASAALFAAVLLLTAWVHDRAGPGAVYTLSAVAALPDLDAVMLSIMRLLQLQQLAPREAVNAVTIAYLSNMLCKSGLVAILAGRAAAGEVVRGYAAIAAGMALGWLLSG